MSISLQTSPYPSRTTKSYCLRDLLAEIAEDPVFQSSFVEIYKGIIFSSVEEC